MRFKKHFMPTSTVKRAIALVLASLLMGAGGVALYWNLRPTPLLKVAYRLSWNTKDADTSSAGYGWLSDTDLIGLRDRPPANANEHRTRYAVRWNLLTGTETRLPALSSVINTVNGDGPFLDNVSPDGRRLLWSSPVSAAPNFYTTFVDGHGLTDVSKKMYQANAHEFMEIMCWMSDSHTILQVSYSDNQNKILHGQYAWKLDLDSSSPVQRLPAIRAGVSDTPQAIIAMSDNRLRVVLSPPPVAAGSNFNEAYLNEARLEEWRVDGQLRHIRQWAVPLPRPAQTFTTLFSPHADRIAWLLETRQQSSLDVLLRRWLPRYPAPVWHQQQLWISRADGSDMRHIGDLPAVGFGTDGRPLQPSMTEDKTEAWQLLWMPGGAKVSFLYKDVLYLVDAAGCD